MPYLSGSGRTVHPGKTAAENIARAEGDARGWVTNGFCDLCHEPTRLRYLDQDKWACERCAADYLARLKKRG